MVDGFATLKNGPVFSPTMGWHARDINSMFGDIFDLW
jgi:hypothetical protein